MAAGESRVERLVYRWSFVAVYACALFSVVWLASTQGRGALGELGTRAVASLLLFGKFIIFDPDSLLGPVALALMVWLIDLMVAFALASGLDSFERAPVLGRWLRRAHTRAREVLTEFPKLENMAFLGVVLFVLLPIASTGAVTGSFAARLVGLSRLAGVVAIAVGSAGTATVFALVAIFLGERGEALLRSPLLAAAMLVGLVVFLRVAYTRVKRILKG